MEFFSAYRQSITSDDNETHDAIDQILNNLFLVHNEVTVHVAEEDDNVEPHQECGDEMNMCAVEQSAGILKEYETLKETQTIIKAGN